MNIGNYKPDGNIMTVPEIKEIVTEGVDISDLKDKVDTIQGNVTTLNGSVSELESGLAETISGLNDTKSDVSDNASNIGDLQAIVQRLTTEINTLRGAVLLENEYTYNGPIFWGYIAGNKTCYTSYTIPKILDASKNYVVDYSGVTSLNMRAGSVVRSFNTAEDVAGIIDSAVVRNGNIQINYKAVAEFTAYETLTVVLNGSLKVKVDE